MYRGTWSFDVTYNKGDIVYNLSTHKYYISIVYHRSGGKHGNMFDCPYWLEIADDFLSRHSTRGIKRTSSDTIIESSSSNNSIKRKLRIAERSICEYKRQKTDVDDLREQLLLLKVDTANKALLVDKYDNAPKSGSEHAKTMQWLRTVCSIPFGKYKSMKVSKDDPKEKIKEYFDSIKKKLDATIYGLEDTKQEILEYVARKITNPDGKGHVLALSGYKGTGKTKLIKSLADALELPFIQINCGGLSDSAVLVGHSETYVGSKPGKIAESLTTSKYMNPIIYLDEIDKLGDHKSTEVNGILTHLLDEEQNDKFQDNYLSSLTLDLSKVFFVISFNDITKVDDIVSDRMKVIYITPPSFEEKVTITTTKMIPDILKTINFDKNVIVKIDKEIIEYIIKNKCPEEKGVRQLKKTLEKLLYRLNYDILIDNEEYLKKHIDTELSKTAWNITRNYVNNTLGKSNNSEPYLSLYT